MVDREEIKDKIEQVFPYWESSTVAPIVEAVFQSKSGEKVILITPTHQVLKMVEGELSRILDKTDQLNLKVAYRSPVPNPEISSYSISQGKQVVLELVLTEDEGV